MKLTLLTLPVSTNNLYSNGSRGRFTTDRGRRNKEQIAWEARAQYRGKPLAGPVAAEITLFWQNGRNHDIDNIKALLDALTGIVWEDDGQIVDLHTMKEVDRANPRVELRVWGLEQVDRPERQKRDRSRGPSS
jgi:crossover junction endodeoxyribonuclease RusA